MSFVERHGLRTADQARQAREVAERIRAEGLELVRLSFPDQHGILRGKALVPEAAIAALGSGCSITTTLFAKDTSHRSVFPVFTPGGGFGLPEMGGAADAVMVPDPESFRLLPWAPNTGWLLCDVHFADGRPVPFATRHLYRSVLERLRARGLAFVAGIEVELHLFRLEDARLTPEAATQPGEPPRVSLLAQGWQYLTEQRLDQFEPVLAVLRRDLTALGLPLRSVEVEFGPSQCELTFAPLEGLAPADLMVLLRSATKQICRRHGILASFMCRPKLPNLASSGWHLHQSLRRTADGSNAFAPETPGEPLSILGSGYLAGLLEHARSAALFTTPTVNGYKRYRPNSLAPDRVAWGRDNRGVMLRVLGPGDATRIENRVGEPAANPYLYMASQILAGLDGIDRGLDAGPSADRPYEAEAPALPRSLGEAIEALDRSDLYRQSLGDAFIDYLLHIKRAELARFEAEVSEWEQREYFELF